MTRDELLQFHSEFTAKMRAICEAKNQDYAGPGKADPFANFRRVEALGIASTEQGFLTRMTDKISRLSSFVAAGSLAVKDESAEDTLIDLANYSLLLAAFLRDKRAATTVAPVVGGRVFYVNDSGDVHKTRGDEAYLYAYDSKETAEDEADADKAKRTIRVMECPE